MGKAMDLPTEVKKTADKVVKMRQEADWTRDCLKTKNSGII